MTPAEVFTIAGARAETAREANQRLAWMVGNLSGFSRPPPYATVFPGKPKPKPKPSSHALFAYFDGVKAGMQRT